MRLIVINWKKVRNGWKKYKQFVLCIFWRKETFIFFVVVVFYKTENICDSSTIYILIYTTVLFFKSASIIRKIRIWFKVEVFFCDFFVLNEKKRGEVSCSNKCLYSGRAKFEYMYCHWSFTNLMIGIILSSSNRSSFFIFIYNVV